MAEAAISCAVKVAGDLLMQKAEFLGSVEGQVRSLIDDLNRMQSCLRDAVRKQHENEKVQNWIWQAREVAHYVQDTIEKVIHNVDNVENKRRIHIGFLIGNCTSNRNPLDRFRDELELIHIRLVAIDKTRESYGIRDIGEAPESSRWRLAAVQRDEQVVGMRGNVSTLLKKAIMNEEKKGLSVAVVVGMGGIGKSTLARKIYNHRAIQAGRFDCRALVVVTSESTPEDTMTRLILELSSSDERCKIKLPEDIEKLEESARENKLYLQEKLQEMLYKQLRGKTYLIVLDNLWNRDLFEYLKDGFPDEQDKTSRLLITTRNNDIAIYDQYVHQMNLLTPRQSCELLLKKASLKETSGNFPHEFESTGREILRKCDGLPLAISIVGGLLVGRQTPSGWEQVLNQITFLGSEKVENSVSTILELGYQDLSPELKSCFLSLAFFKDEETILVKRLAHMWVGQGLIQQRGRRIVEKIARNYLDELISRNMVQIREWTLDNQVKSCYLNDLVREVCVRKAKEEIGFEILNEQGDSAGSSSYNPRHCLVHCQNINNLPSMQNRYHLRSLFLQNVIDGMLRKTRPLYWKGFKLLRTLDLDVVGLKKFPHSLRELLGLKYLRIHRNHKKFIAVESFVVFLSSEPLKLPSWLDQLKHLEILELGNYFVEFPDKRLKMEKLRYFRGFVRGRMGIENWKTIETLKYIELEHLRLTDNCHAHELGIVLSSRIGTLALYEKMENLEKLHLMFRNFSKQTIIIPRLSNLTKIKLSGKMYTYPTAGMFPPNLSHLTLEATVLENDLMPELGKLPKLMYLKIQYRAYIGRIMLVVGDGFPLLKVLSLRELYDLMFIEVEEGGMPQLKHLRIQNCRKLDHISKYLQGEHINLSLDSTHCPIQVGKYQYE